MTRTLLALLALTALALTACSGGDDDDVAAILALDGSPTAGKAVYDNKCASCHKPDGSGDSTFPSLVTKVPQESDEDIIEVILNGKGAMQGFRDELSDQQVADLHAYLRETFAGA